MAGAAPTAKPAPFLRPLDTLDRGVLLAESALSVVIVMVMVLVAVAESVSRMAHISVPALRGAGDILLNGTIWAAFLGASFATRGRKHLAIDALGRLLPERGRRVMVAVAATLGSIIAFALARGIYRALLEAAVDANEQLANLLRSGATVAEVDRLYEFQFVIPGGFLLISVRLLLHAFHEFVAAQRGDAAIVPGAHGEPKAPRAGSNGAEAEGPYREAAEESASNTRDMVEPSRDAPVAHATATEIIIALVALVLLTVLARGTSVMRQLSFATSIAGLTLAIPLLLRKRRTGTWDPTAIRESDPTVVFTTSQMLVALLAIAGIVLAARFAVTNVSHIPTTWGVLFFALMAILGAPLFTFLGGLALFLWLHGSVDVQAQSLPNSVVDALGPHFARMSVLPTIPVFTLAGYLMSESKTPERLVRLARAALGWAPGGLAIVCLLTSSLFTVFSGASGITIVAIGGLLLPAMLKDKYPEKFSLGLVTTGGALGITLPFCLPMIVYGIVAGLQEPAPGHERLDLQKFMLAGIIPALLAVGLFVVYAIIVAIFRRVPRANSAAPVSVGLLIGIGWLLAPVWMILFTLYAMPVGLLRAIGVNVPRVADLIASTFGPRKETETDSTQLRDFLLAIDETKWELLVIVFLPIALIFFGPTVAAVLITFYVIIIEVFVYKDLSITKDLPRIVPESMILVGAIFVKVCAATILTSYFVQAQTADRLFEWLTCGPPAQHYLHAHSDTLGTCREAVDVLARAGQSAGGIIDSKLSFLIALNVFLLIVGMLMDIFSAIVVVVPLIAGIALHFDINPYHLGIVFLFNLEIGYVMPPMGLNLFIAGFRFNRPVPDLYRMVGPFIVLFIAALLITTYVPSLTLLMVPGQHAAPLAANPQPGSPGTAAPPTAAGNVVDAAAHVADATVASADDCAEQRDGETFEQFDVRCNITGQHPHDAAAAAPHPPPPTPAAAPTDCDEPRDGETFAAFDQRCHITGGASPAPNAPAALPTAAPDAGPSHLGDAAVRPAAAASPAPGR